jgi:hypothetical protein
LADFLEQEDYATKHNVSEEDRMAIEDGANKPVDPMQGLEGLDQAGPKLNWVSIFVPLHLSSLRFPLDHIVSAWRSGWGIFSSLIAKIEFSLREVLLWAAKYHVARKKRKRKPSDPSLFYKAGTARCRSWKCPRHLRRSESAMRCCKKKSKSTPKYPFPASRLFLL